MLGFSQPVWVSLFARLGFFGLLTASIGFAAEDERRDSHLEPGAGRLIVIKVDGLPPQVLEAAIDLDGPAVERVPYPDLFREAHHFVRTASGRVSLLPNLEAYFFRQGIRPRVVYSGTLALSAPSWAMIDTGLPSIIKTNSYFNRTSGELATYLDQFRESYNVMAKGAGKTTALWQLDLLGAPILSDSFSPDRSWTSIQFLYRRRPGDHLASLGRHVITGGQPGRNPFNVVKRHLSERVQRTSYPEKADQALALLAAEKVLERDDSGKEVYDLIEFVFPTMDHQFHFDADYRNIFSWLMKLDGWMGQVMAAVENSERRNETLVVVVSDHGQDFDPIHVNYALPINRLLREPAFGSHATLAPMVEELDHALTVPVRGIDFTRLYESESFPYGRDLPFGEKGFVTAFTANNGNPRFDASLRHSDLNRLHLLLLEILRAEKDTEILLRIFPVFESLMAEIAAWLPEEIRRIDLVSSGLEQLRRSYKVRDDSSARDSVRRLDQEIRSYRRTGATLSRLAVLPREREPWLQWARSKFMVSDLLPKNYLGPTNRLEQLQNYVAGWEGPAAERWENTAPTFRTIDYPALFTSYQATNPSAYGNRFPFNFFSIRIPLDEFEAFWDRPVLQLIWLKFSDTQEEALIVESENGDLLYQPIGNLRRIEGRYHAEPVERLDRLGYSKLSGRWMSPRQWGKETLEQEFTILPVVLAELFRPNHESLLSSPHLRKRLSEREGVDPDLVLQALRVHFEFQDCDFRVWTNRGWNVNSNQPSPGGSHGAFHELETQVVFMAWGGDKVELNRGKDLDGIYFTYDIVPTLLSALNMLGPGGYVQPQKGALPQAHFPQLPGTVIPLLHPHPSSDPD